MKKSLFPLALVLAAASGALATGHADDMPAAPKPAPAEAAPAEAKPKGPTYRVVDEAEPGMPAELVKALKAAQMAPPPDDLVIPAMAKVQLQTTKGNITVQLDTKGAPLHAKSFYYLASKGFFDGTSFHRWADLLEGSGTKGYIIQGGDPLTKDPANKGFAGVGGPGYQIPREHNKSTHEALVIAAARTSDPNSAGSQFYITQNPVKFLDQGDGYTVFGKIIEGKDAALKLRQDDVVKKATVQ